jgi:hypothetical protein
LFTWHGHVDYFKYGAITAQVSVDFEVVCVIYVGVKAAVVMVQVADKTRDREVDYIVGVGLWVEFNLVIWEGLWQE